ncbi:MAG: hypothetical protein RLZZ235_894, partial [Pseudomonadota bacterium]
APVLALPWPSGYMNISTRARRLVEVRAAQVPKACIPGYMVRYAN